MKSPGVVTTAKQEAMSPGLEVSRSRGKMYLPQLVGLLSALFFFFFKLQQH